VLGIALRFDRQVRGDEKKNSWPRARRRQGKRQGRLRSRESPAAPHAAKAAVRGSVDERNQGGRLPSNGNIPRDEDFTKKGASTPNRLEMRNAPEELTTDGSTFELRGHLTSGNLRGAVFAGTCDVSSRSGRLILKRA
jgi:hypothetical protein